ncbi:hypothetical protein Asp14428_73640 [Actinoplanes sp. NBRC 14428]|nr:hypothetical protein Asp14428_73640 [Actinoplanes sp. NBRC 14428]
MTTPDIFSRSVMAVALVGTTIVAALGLPPAPLAAALADGPQPVNVVVLVDQSGSLRADGVEAEREAAKIITQSEFSSRSRLGVVGFASANGDGHGPVDVVCPMEEASAGTARERYQTCIDRLAIRPKGRDDDTDFPSALRQGLEMLGQAGGDAPRIIFLLTDGVLDVSDSEIYGGDAALRNDVAQDQLDDLLEQARRDRVQVWPLGFGSDVDKAKLDAFARSGGRQPCNSSAPEPSATVVAGPADVVASLQNAFAAARCGAQSPVQRTPLPSGDEKTLEVEIPPIATYGSLTVVKRDPAIQVSYVDPVGTTVTKTGQHDDSTFEVSGERSGVEVLRIRHPKPGTWKIRLKSPPQTPDQEVSARVLWQGVVQAAVVVNPPQPVPGQPVTVSVNIYTAAGTVDAESLRGLTVRVRASGAGVPDTLVRVADDGRDGDRTAGDGEFSGRMSIPAVASGTLKFAGEVAGAGIVTDRRVAEAPTQREMSLFASLELPSGERVAPGRTVRGKVHFSNRAGARTSVRLVLADPDAGTLATINPATLEVPPGNGTTEQDFTIAFDRGTRKGPAAFTVRVVDAGSPDVVYGNAPVRYEIGPEPLPWWFWVAVAAAAALVLGLITVLWRRRRASDVRKLSVVLYRADGSTQALPAPVKGAAEFPFVVRTEKGGTSRLDLAGAGEPAYVVTRRADGTYRLGTPSGGTEELTGSRRYELPDDAGQVGIGDSVVPQRRPRHDGVDGPPPSARRTDDDDSLVW